MYPVCATQDYSCIPAAHWPGERLSGKISNVFSSQFLVRLGDPKVRRRGKVTVTVIPAAYSRSGTRVHLAR